MNSREQANVGIVLVAFGNEDSIATTLDRLAQGKRSADQIVLVDNHPEHKTAAIAEKHAAVDRVVRSDNVGFGAGCNKGASLLKKNIDIIFFLNPDTVPASGALNKLRQAPSDWAAWMPLLVTADSKVNTAGNVLHVSGLSWISHFGEPASDFTKPEEVNLLSGACLVIRRPVWDDLGGFDDSYFMYYEDTDLCLRLKLKGHRLGLVPLAQVVHDYTFKKGSYKFFYLERNRTLLIIRTWPLGVILVLLPLLLASEIGLWAVSLLERRFWLKVKSTGSFLKALPGALVARRAIQKSRIMSAYDFMGILEPEVNTPLLGVVARLPLINSVFKLYYLLAKACLKIVS